MWAVVVEVESERKLLFVVEEQPGGQSFNLPFRRELFAFSSPSEPDKYHSKFSAHDAVAS